MALKNPLITIIIITFKKLTRNTIFVSDLAINGTEKIGVMYLARLQNFPKN